jgi:hypothetical protein
MIAIGFGLAWVSATYFLQQFISGPRWRFSSLDEAIYGAWAFTFILLGIAICRARWWSQMVVLAVLPLYFDMRISDELRSLIVGPGPGRHIIIPNLTIHCAALIASAAIFAFLCTSSAAWSFGNRNEADPLGIQRRVAIRAWALGCAAHGLVHFVYETLELSVPDAPQQHLTFPLLCCVLLIAGLFALKGNRFAWLAATGALIALGSYDVIWYALDSIFPYSVRDASRAWRLHIYYGLCALIYALLYFSAAAFGICAGRRLRRDAR